MWENKLKIKLHKPKEEIDRIISQAIFKSLFLISQKEVYTSQGMRDTNPTEKSDTLTIAKLGRIARSTQNKRKKKKRKIMRR